MREQDPTNEFETERYYQWQFASLKANGHALIVRNFEADLGRVTDLWTYDGKPKHEGYIQNDYGYGCDVNQLVNGRYQRLNEKPLVYEAAELLLKRTVGLE